MKRPVYYFDMDGVLAIFDERASVEKPFMRPGSHFFRKCEPDERAVAILEAMAREENRCEVIVLSRLPANLSDTLAKEQAADKMLWCEDVLPENVDVIVIRANDKTGVLLEIPAPERSYHVLIDDDPEIVRTWRAAGGTAIQYVQPHRNLKRIDGPSIGPDTTTEQAIELLRALA